MQIRELKTVEIRPTQVLIRDDYHFGGGNTYFEHLSVYCKVASGVNYFDVFTKWLKYEDKKKVRSDFMGAMRKRQTITVTLVKRSDNRIWELISYENTNKIIANVETPNNYDNSNSPKN